MKKLFTIIAIFGCLTLVFGQSFKTGKNKKVRNDDFSMSIKEKLSEKIDWKLVKEFLSDKKENDTVQFSIKLIPESKNKNLTSIKTYSVRGIYKNIDEMILKMEKMLKPN